MSTKVLVTVFCILGFAFRPAIKAVNINRLLVYFLSTFLVFPISSSNKKKSIKKWEQFLYGLISLLLCGMAHLSRPNSAYLSSVGTKASTSPITRAARRLPSKVTER